MVSILRRALLRELYAVDISSRMIMLSYSDDTKMKIVSGRKVSAFLIFSQRRSSVECTDD